jgi:hypothetical protein
MFHLHEHERKDLLHQCSLIKLIKDFYYSIEKGHFVGFVFSVKGLEVLVSLDQWILEPCVLNNRVQVGSLASVDGESRS